MFMDKQNNSNNGFTLAELLIVAAIIGILVVISILIFFLIPRLPVC